MLSQRLLISDEMSSILWTTVFQANITELLFLFRTNVLYISHHGVFKKFPVAKRLCSAFAISVATSYLIFSFVSFSYDSRIGLLVKKLCYAMKTLSSCAIFSLSKLACLVWLWLLRLLEISHGLLAETYCFVFNRKKRCHLVLEAASLVFSQA